jgi:hypothetical protein
MGPAGHLGIALGAGYVSNRVPHLKLNLWVVAFSALLPDLLDKPLYVLGIGDGRYVGHTLLFVFLVAGAVSFKNKRWGLSVLFGAILHLLLDSGGVPWLYPFVNYDFIVAFDPRGISARLSTLFDTLTGRSYDASTLAAELIGLIIVIGTLWYLSWRYFRAKRFFE